jgi:hypothetical protein
MPAPAFGTGKFAQNGRKINAPNARHLFRGVNTSAEPERASPGHARSFRPN